MSHPSSERLSALLDGDLETGPREAVESHVAACPRCSGRLEELRRLVGVLEELVDRPPERDLWQAIRSAIGPGSGVARRRLALAASALLLIGAGAWLALRSPSPVAPAAAAAPPYALPVGDATALLENLRPRLDPASSELLLADLAVLDRAIAELRQALAEEPGNRWLVRRLEEMSRSKWTYLREAPGLAPPRFAGG